MPPLPGEIVTLLQHFACLFSQRVWLHAEILIVGAILSQGKRTVTSALRTMGLQNEIC